MNRRRPMRIAAALAAAAMLSSPLCALPERVSTFAFAPPAGERVREIAPDGEGFAAITVREGDGAHPDYTVFFGAAKKGPFEYATFVRAVDGGAAACLVVDGGKGYALSRSDKVGPFLRPMFSPDYDSRVLLSAAGRIVACSYSSDVHVVNIWVGGKEYGPVEGLAAFGFLPNGEFLYGAADGTRKGGEPLAGGAYLEACRYGPDGTIDAYASMVPAGAGREYAVVDAAAGARYTGYSALASGLFRGADGKLRFLAKRGGKLIVAIGGAERALAEPEAWDAALSADGTALVFMAGTPDATRASYADLARTELVDVAARAPGGKPARFAYRKDGALWIAGYGKDLGPFERAGVLREVAAGASPVPLYYFARKGAEYVGLGGAIWGPFDAIDYSSVVLGARSTATPLFAASKKGAWGIYEGDRLIGEIPEPRGGASIAPDGKTFLILAGIEGDKATFVDAAGAKSVRPMMPSSRPERVGTLPVLYLAGPGFGWRANCLSGGVLRECSFDPIGRWCAFHEKGILTIVREG